MSNILFLFAVYFIWFDKLQPTNFKKLLEDEVAKLKEASPLPPNNPLYRQFKEAIWVYFLNLFYLELLSSFLQRFFVVISEFDILLMLLSELNFAIFVMKLKTLCIYLFEAIAICFCFHIIFHLLPPYLRQFDGAEDW